MRKLILALLVLPLSAFAGTASLTWVAPTQNTDGSAITGAITYKVYRGLQGQTKTLLASPAGSATAYTDATAPVGTVCYAVTATVGGQESAQSAQSCKVVAAPIPNPPTGLVVADVTAFQVIGTPNKFALVPVGTVPAGTACDTSQSVNGYYAVPRTAVTWFGSTRPQVVVAQCG